MKPRIYVDLDGVIVDFVKPAMDYWGATINDESEYPPECGWDVVGATNFIRKERGRDTLTTFEFWNELRYEFWLNLPLYPGAALFLRDLERVGEIYFATSPTLSSECVAGKHDWIKNNYPDMLRRYYIGADKTAFAKSGDILIDDRDKNVDDFNKAGGIAFLIPRPWNRGGYRPRPYDYVIEVLRSNTL